MPSGNDWRSWFKKLGYLEKPRAERRIPIGFDALRRDGPGSKPATIRDISSTGLHILTEERWPIGDLIPLTLEVEGLAEDHSEPRIAVQARVARHTDDGIGLSFVLPEGLDQELWDVLLRNAVVLTDPNNILYTLKVLRTILFLCRICRNQAKEAIVMLGGELDKQRVENATEIAFAAETMLASNPDFDRMRAPAPLIATILNHGSWADEFTRQLWAGLLVTSCSIEGGDESNKVYVDLLINLTRHQCLIFVGACIRALKLMPGSEHPPQTRIILSPEEMIRMSGKYDVSRIATDVAHLFNSGLLDKLIDFRSYIPLESFDITPSRLGLELFERCKGKSISPALLLDTPEGAYHLPPPYVPSAEDQPLPPPQFPDAEG
jgi:hypothetical protein